MTLADRVYALLPTDSQHAMSPRQISELLPGERDYEISRACRTLRKWRLVDFRAGHGKSNRACLLWWRID